VVAAFLIVSMVLAGTHWHAAGVFWGWELLGVPRMPPPDHPFTDTISITRSIDCIRDGLDPYLTGLCDPWGRTFNYPPVWLNLRTIGISSATTLTIGIAMAGVTALAFLTIFRTSSWPGFLIVLLTLLSPAILFGIERGNVDTLLFSILAFGLFATRALNEPTRRIVRAALVIGLTILKAYPIATCNLFLDRTKRGWVTAIGIGILALAAFALSSADKIQFIFANTPLTSGYSFGSAPVFLDLAEQLTGPDFNRTHVRWLATGVAVVLGLGVTAWAIRSHSDLSRVLPPLDRGRFADDLCLACLAVFCVCFLLGSNFNYRLIFLAGTLPKLVESYDSEREARLLIAPATVIALLWAVRLPNIVDHALNWVTYIGACAWIGDAVRRPDSTDRAPGIG
jgi:hypothetical protein